MAQRNRLADRLTELGIPRNALARLVGVNESTIWRWLNDLSEPRDYQRGPLAVAIHVPLDELDWYLAVDDRPVAAGSVSHVGDDFGLEYDPSIPATLDAVDTLGHADMERRAFLKNALFVVSASVAPSRDWLLATIDEATAPTRLVSSSQVDAIRRTFGAFQELDVMRGGGHARHQLAAYLTSSVTPLLRMNDPATDTGRALFEAGAEQLYLIGWMAFDDGKHVLAQRYLIQALRLAQEAHSTELGAHVLAGLADQANLTGNPAQALQLARAGRVGLKRGRSPACLADLWALQARAEASLSDSKAVARSINESERAADNVSPGEEPEWARFILGAYLHGEYANAFHDVDRPNEAARFAALSADEARQQGRARRGSLAHATLARSALDDHDLEVAAAEATTTVELAATVTSSRSIEAVADLRSRLSGHTGSPAVVDFLDRASVLLPA